MTARAVYDTKHNCTLPDDVFDPRYMTPYHSELDTTDVSAGELSESESESESEPSSGAPPSEVPTSSENIESTSTRLTPRERKIKSAKAKHYAKMAKKANLTAEDEAAEVPVWEKRPQPFKSRKVSDIYPMICIRVKLTASSTKKFFLSFTRSWARTVPRRKEGGTYELS